MTKRITSEVVLAYTQCSKKAYLLLCTDEHGAFHEYIQVLEQRKLANETTYLNTLKRQHTNVQTYNTKSFERGGEFLSNVKLQYGVLEASCGCIMRIPTASVLGEYSYEPMIFVGTYCISQEQRLELFFVGYVLKQLQGKLPLAGQIIDMELKTHRVKLENSCETLSPIIQGLQDWIQAPPIEIPVSLNKHCPYCQFKGLCYSQAKEADSLSLLDQITPKIIQRYEKKGIFTVKQLSYLYKPRRRKKRRNEPPPRHSVELQALAIRTGKIYLESVFELKRSPVELFLDIEGIPDQQYEYLIGLLICISEDCEYYSFWADTQENEGLIWWQFVEKINQYPDVPIYHYGNYEARAIKKLAKRHAIGEESLQERLINVNGYIYGRVYFPVYSNRLKDIGHCIGATWSASEASGLQSIVWRYHWDEAHNDTYRDLLMTYNREDCQGLKMLLDKLSSILHSANASPEIDFANHPKHHTTETGDELHKQFDAILKIAHIDYEGKRISLAQVQESIGKSEKGKRGARKGHIGYRKIVSEIDKVVHIPVLEKCPTHTDIPLKESNVTVNSIVIDLVFTGFGISKTIVKYIGRKGYCQKCNKYYSPPEITHGSTIYGHGLRSWGVYHRLFLRLPYRMISDALEDQFDEAISLGSISNFIRYFSEYYAETEIQLTEKLLKSPFIHADETKVNIEGVEQYVWVFTDGEHVIFRLTETREATMLYEFLDSYQGILVSDFYPGYDAVKCGQQKCWVHLIRDINDDLWKYPFDSEFETFALAVRDLIVPILELANRHGLKKEHFSKYKCDIDRFYDQIISKSYKSELAVKYQKRFLRYRESLFTFLEYEGIPWNNNMAERALRHLAVQRKISGFFFKTIMPCYLLLLGIMQSCRFQNKSLLKFLLSKEKDIDAFNKNSL